MDGYHLVEPLLYRDGEEEPDGRNHDEDGKKEEELPGLHLQVSLPDLLQVGLHHVLGDGDLLLVVDQRIDEAHVLHVQRVEDLARALHVGGDGNQVLVQLLTDITDLQEIRGPILLLERGLPVLGREVGRCVTGRRRDKDKVLYGLVLVVLAHDHEVEDELTVVQQIFRVMVLPQKIRHDVEIILSSRVPAENPNK